MNQEPLETGRYYHIYNRGINSCVIFNSPENKRFFIQQFNKYMTGAISLYAYCLMENHYHIVIRVNEPSLLVTQKFSNFLNSYVKAFNKQNERTGSLFEKHFKRVKLDNEEYLRTVIVYVHLNPTKHLNVDFTAFKYSSYSSYVINESDELSKSEVLELFDGLDNFIKVHQDGKDVLENKFKLE